MLRIPGRYSAKDKKLVRAIRRMTGYSPVNIELYNQATIHRSVANSRFKGIKESNERLEFLGDAVLDIIIAEYLFKKFPFKDEGFLTEIKARIVNRENLNNLARKVGVDQITVFEQEGTHQRAYKSIYGNTLEAIIGAVYLDLGFKICNKFIIKKLILPHTDLEVLVKNNPNYKSRIIEWAQKENKDLSFDIIEVSGENHHREFTAQLEIDNTVVSTGNGFSKKKAEQDAAFKACELLNIE